MSGHEAKDAKLFRFEEGQLIRFESYEIDEEGNIRPARKCRFYAFNPFDFYYSPVPQEIVLDIFPEKRFAGLSERPFYLHTLFASLDPDNTEQFLRFVKHFGMPYWEVAEGEFYGEIFGYPIEITPPGLRLRGIDQDDSDDPKELRQILIEEGRTPAAADALIRRLVAPGRWRDRVFDRPWENRTSIPLKELLDELWLFKWTTELAAAYLSGDVALLEKLLNDGARRIADTPQGFSWDLHYYADEILTVGCDDVFLSARDFLETVMMESLADVTPKLMIGSLAEARKLREEGLFGKVPMSINLSWSFTSLLSAMYLMLLLDLTQGKKLRKCAHVYCGRFFIANRDDTKYCSPQCQNRARIRRFTLRKKAKEAAESTEPGPHGKEGDTCHNHDTRQGT